MITPIYIPTQRQPSYAEKAQEAAYEYSSKTEMQEAFLDGTKFGKQELDCDLSPSAFFLGALGLSWICSFFFGIFIGVVEQTELRWNTPGYFIFWPFNLGKFIGLLLTMRIGR